MPLPSHIGTVLIAEVKGIANPIRVRIVKEGLQCEESGTLIHPSRVQHFVIDETPAEKTARTEALYLEAERQRAILLS